MNKLQIQFSIDPQHKQMFIFPPRRAETFYFLFEQELPVRASAYMDNALRPLHQLLTDSTGLVTPSTAQEWLRVTLSECTQRSASASIKNQG